MRPNEQHIGPEEIAAYFAGELKPEERAMLESWVQSSEENRMEFDAYRELWQQAQKEPDTEAALQMVLERIRRWESSPLARKPSWYALPLKIAAILLPIMLVGYLVFYALDRESVEQLHTATDTMETNLPDGSKITLNTNTTLTYPQKLSGKTRSVELEGEAYFEVARMPQKPFIVQAGGLQVKVLGTEFNVKAIQGEDSIKVDVSEGIVMLKAMDQTHVPDSVILKAGESGLFILSERKFIHSSKFNPNSLFWKNGVLVFNKTPLEDVAKQVERAYDTEIVLKDSSLQSLRLTTTFEQATLEEIMDIVSQTFALEWTSNDSAIIIHRAENGKE